MLKQRSRHRADPTMDGGAIFSGDRAARVVFRDEQVAVGHGDDGSVWVLVLDSTLRPRGHERFEVLAAPVTVEPNGLVRILDRRVPWSAVERLLADLSLTVQRSATEEPASVPIPDGDYEGVQVRRIDHFYEVALPKGDPRPFEALAVEQLGPRRWLVAPAAEPMLRRALVDHMLPLPARILGGRGRLQSPTLRQRWIEPLIRRTMGED